MIYRHDNNICQRFFNVLAVGSARGIYCEHGERLVMSCNTLYICVHLIYFPLTIFDYVLVMLTQTLCTYPLHITSASNQTRSTNHLI